MRLHLRSGATLRLANRNLTAEKPRRASCRDVFRTLISPSQGPLRVSECRVSVRDVRRSAPHRRSDTSPTPCRSVTPRCAEMRLACREMCRDAPEKYGSFLNTQGCAERCADMRRKNMVHFRQNIHILNLAVARTNHIRVYHTNNIRVYHMVRKMDYRIWNIQ